MRFFYKCLLWSFVWKVMESDTFENLTKKKMGGAPYEKPFIITDYIFNGTYMV